MKNKTIAFVSPGKAELSDLDMPVIKDGEVLIKTAVSTISAGTERANLTGDPNVSYAQGPRVTFPRYGGYSVSGVIEEIGNGVEGLCVGDLVACSWTKHAQYNAVRQSRVYKLPDGVSLENGALVHIATFPLAAIRKCRLEIGESAIVMGQGVLGMIAVKLLRAAGAAPIIAADPDPKKREQALLLGADYALDPLSPDFADTVKQVTGKGVQVAIEVTGRGAGLDGVLDCMRPFGRVALLGCTRNSDFTIDYYRKVHGPGITLIGAHTNARPKQDSSDGWWTERDDALAIIKLMELGRLDLASMVSETHSPSEAAAVYERLATEPTFPIVQYDWSELE